MLSLNVWNILFTIINLLILYFALKKFLIGPVTAMMDKRRDMIEGGFADADRAQKEAQSLKAQYEKTLAAVHDESSKIVENAHMTAKNEYERIVGAAKKEADAIVVKAQKAAGEEQKKALQEVESQIAGLAMAAAAKIIGEAGRQSKDAALYDQFIKKAGDASDTNSR